jgi:hypothetical protein
MFDYAVSGDKKIVAPMLYIPSWHAPWVWPYYSLLIIGWLVVLAYSINALHKKKPGAWWVLCGALLLALVLAVRLLCYTLARSEAQFISCGMVETPILFLAIACFLHAETLEGEMTWGLKASRMLALIVIALSVLALFLNLVSPYALPVEWINSLLCLIGLSSIALGLGIHLYHRAKHKKEEVKE